MVTTYPTEMTVILTVSDILVYIRDDIRSRIIECENLPNSFEGLVIELSFNLKKWLLICFYNPHRNSIKEHMRVLSCCLDQNIQKYENIILMGDYNAEVTETSMQVFCESYFLESMVKKPVCFKNLQNLHDNNKQTWNVSEG